MIRVFRHYLPVSLVVLTATEFSVFVGIGLYAGVYHGDASGTAEAAYKPWLFAALLTLFNSMFGLYDFQRISETVDYYGPVSLYLLDVSRVDSEMGARDPVLHRWFNRGLTPPDQALPAA